MRVLGTISIAVVFLLLAGSVTAYSQEESRPGQAQEQKDKAQDQDKDKAKHEDKAAKQEEQKHDHDQSGAKQDEHRGQSDATKQEKQEQKLEKQQQKEERSEQKVEREQNQHPVAGEHGKRIPDDKFRAHFGRQHTFHVQRERVINVSQPVVVYGGYSFQLVEAWPLDWGFDDDCYIDYVDGEYFLFNAFRPGIRIAVFVVG